MLFLFCCLVADDDALFLLTLTAVELGLLLLLLLLLFETLLESELCLTEFRLFVDDLANVLLMLVDTIPFCSFVIFNFLRDDELVVVLIESVRDLVDALDSSLS